MGLTPLFCPSAVSVEKSLSYSFIGPLRLDRKPPTRRDYPQLVWLTYWRSPAGDKGGPPGPTAGDRQVQRLVSQHPSEGSLVSSHE